MSMVCAFCRFSFDESKQQHLILQKLVQRLDGEAELGWVVPKEENSAEDRRC